ncbi:MAG: small multidrug resistance family protein [Verrucomicrobiales bacterium]|jgi:multidrug transporter EmrE-like cation transporter|nr:small multidrug resistance family protein [Verrucomicrobiales bacterium]MDB6130730.1 small multidrug resistance family protein [Verrucomicrobiales bacterium]
MNPLSSAKIAWLLVLAAGVNSCAGNLMLKRSRLHHSGSFVTLLSSPWFMGGLLFYGVNVLLFAKALEKLPVSQAYPVLAGFGFALLVFSASYFFGERLGIRQWAGLGSVLVGIYLLALE